MHIRLQKRKQKDLPQALPDVGNRLCCVPAAFPTSHSSLLTALWVVQSPALHQLKAGRPGTGYGVGDQGAGAWRSWDSDPGLAVKPVLPESPRWSLHPLGSVKMWGAPRQCGVQSWCGHGGWQASLHPRPLMSRALGVSVCQDLVRLPNSAKVEAA